MRSKIVLAVSLAVLASACNKKAEGQTVAVVNGEEITAAELNAELASAKVPEGADKALVRSRVLERMIDRRLIAQQAKSDGIDKSPEFLNRQRKATEDLLLTMFASRQIDTAQLPAASEVEKYQAARPWMFANREQWNLDQVRFAMPTDAAVRKRLDEAKSLGDVEKVLTDAGIAFTRQKNRLDTALVPQPIYAQINKTGTGEPFIIPVGGEAVASVVTSREPAPLTGEQARPIAVGAMRRDKAATLMQDRLKTVRQAAKIEYGKDYAPKKQ